MNKKLIIFLLVVAFSVGLLFARSYRVNQVPYGSTYSCNTCHTSGGGTPRNAFGQAVGSITGSSDVVFWGATLAALDSDGDTFSNGVELQDSLGAWTAGSSNPGNASAVTHPGDATDYPTITAFAATPVKFELNANYPNPFNPITLISYSLPEYSHVMITIYNVLGEKVKMLVNESAPQGSYVTLWNGQDDLGEGVNSGIYFYQMTAGDFRSTQRMILMK